MRKESMSNPFPIKSKMDKGIELELPFRLFKHITRTKVI